jgi:ABC-2 type transport system permease protein
VKVFYQAGAFLRRDYLLARSARLTFAWQVLTIAFVTPTMYYLGRLVEPASASRPALVGGDYFAFAILGVAFLSFLTSTMGASAAAIRNEQVGGTLEAVLAAPASLLTLAAGAALWPILLAASQTGLYLALGALVFRIDFSHANFPAAAVILGLAITAFGALGILAAAFVLIAKRSDPLTGMFASASVLLSGVLYPIDVLPPALRWLAQAFPLTHALRGLRLALLRGYGIAALQGEAGALVIFCATVAPLASFVFRWALGEAKRSGTLGGY